MQIGGSGFVEAVLLHGADAAIIDCSPPTLVAAILASAWNVPLIGYMTTIPELSDKSTYSTFTRVCPPYSITPLMRSLMAQYNWTTFGILKEVHCMFFQFLVVISQCR